MSREQSITNTVFPTDIFHGLPMEHPGDTLYEQQSGEMKRCFLSNMGKGSTVSNEFDFTLPN